MEKSENTSERALNEKFRGPSGWEGTPLDLSEREAGKTRRVLAGGLVIASLLVIAVIFFFAPSASPSFRPNIAPRCIDNSACEHLEGDCCPGPDGIRLECCKDFDNIVTPTKISKTSCDSNSACSKAGLVGACCPNNDGIELSCCTDVNNTVLPLRPASAMCANNPGCKRMGLTSGFCCPGGDTSLDCCPSLTTDSDHSMLSLYSGSRHSSFFSFNYWHHH
uniref:Uncharacterized protein n=1 Tax=Aureoumbra lagunensis TaxID=44058 RepID=A0A6S8DZ96_9STRA